ncbi:acyl carrier protein [Amycolatopsis speibonae]|uniref:Acyl carrier protein n=1 Tax=Amycolatopsis speibonae TaxID=1450224 RepID=A0ABV7P0G0_9PSEU
MFEVLQEILVGKLKIPAVEVRADVTPEDADLDSLTIVELSMVLEKEFGIEISEDEIKRAETLGDIARLMEQRSTRV